MCLSLLSSGFGDHGGKSKQSEKKTKIQTNKIISQSLFNGSDEGEILNKNHSNQYNRKNLTHAVKGHAISTGGV